MPEKTKQPEPSRDDGVELETQFILRVPEEPAKSIREAIQSGAGNLKDRLLIKIEQDLRYGEVRFDHWLMHSKIVDLPTIMESLKTIDNKSFYKTADICQLMICKDEPDLPSTEEESPNKNKKKDPNKVDKKFLWPHGITPPCKNIRKRRFRKTLKKKYVEAPEIEKEVKRLLCSDNDAVNVKYEIINEDEESQKDLSSDQVEEILDVEEQKPSVKLLEKCKNENNPDLLEDTPSVSQSASRGLGEHDIFGEEVSSSEEEDNNICVIDMEEGSRLSADDSRLSELSIPPSNTEKPAPIEFDKSMFNSPKSEQKPGPSGQQMQLPSSSPDTSREFYEHADRSHPDSKDFSESKEKIALRLMETRKQFEDLKNQQMQKAQEIASIQNPTLRQRLQDTLDNLSAQILEKEMEIHQLENIL